MKKLDYKSKQVRLFLVILLLVAGLITFRFTKEHPFLRTVFWGAETLLVVFFLMLPKLFFPVFKGIMIGSGYIGNFIFLVISTITFYGVLTPIAVIMRLFGKRFIETKTNLRLSTYFEEGSSAHDIEKQY